MNDYSKYDALGLAELVSKGQVTASELMEEAISRAAAVNPKINAIVGTMNARGRKDALTPVPGPFTGVPFLLKDIHAAYAGVPLTNGSRLLRKFRPQEDAEIVRRYKRGGLIVFGKTNTSEFGLLPVAEPDLFGPTRNPWNTNRTAGGSSGGAAAAVAAGIVPMAHGSDGGGSIRIPSSCCGLFGFKPSRGISPNGPDASELFFGYGTQHVLTHTVRDSATALDVVAGPERASFYRAIPVLNYAQAVQSPVPPLRIALTTDPFLPADVHPECDAAARRAATFCEDLGHTVEEAAPNINTEEFGRDYTVMCAAGVSLALRLWEGYFGRPVGRPDVEEVTALYREIGNNLSGPEVMFARDRLMAAQREMARFFRRYHVMLTPTLALPPVKIGHFEPRGLLQQILDLSLTLPFKDVFKSEFAREQVISWVVRYGYSFTPYAPLANIAGLPSMNVPLFQNQKNLPIGVMFTSALGRDTLLFKLAAQLESAHPWRQRKANI